MSAGPPGYQSYRLTNEICPIFLRGGIAANVTNGAGKGIIEITQSEDFAALQSGVANVKDFDNYFAHFKPLPGATLIENAIGKYPFANQATAANAQIAQALQVSLLMYAPARLAGSYGTRQSKLTQVQNQLYKHTAQGGYYTVVTPAFVYPTALLTKLSDITPADSKQGQIIWQWDFEVPLITQDQVQQALSAYAAKFTNRVPLAGDPISPSGSNATSANPASGALATNPLVASVGGAQPAATGLALTTGIAGVPASVVNVVSAVSPQAASCLTAMNSAAALVQTANGAMLTAGPGIIGNVLQQATGAVQAAQTSLAAAGIPITGITQATKVLGAANGILTAAQTALQAVSTASGSPSAVADVQAVLAGARAFQQAAGAARSLAI